MNQIILSDRMYIPKTLMPLKAIKSRYHIDLFKEKMCDKCENKDQRPNDLCKGCEGFTGSYRLFKDNPNHYSVPQGDQLALFKLLDRKSIDYTVKDKRKEIPFRFNIKFTGKLFGEGHIDENGIPRINQKRLLKTWFKYKDGMLRARPRAGKTVMAVYTACRLQQKTVIMADRFELLNQFYKTFMGDKKKKRPPMSNIPRLRRETGKEVIRVATKSKDLKNLKDVDILLVNYQKLVRDPKRMAELVNGNFSFLIVDEAHGAGADGYLKVVSNCSVKHRMGLTATPNRKDNRHRLIHRIMGPVVAASESASLIPEVNIRSSKTTPRSSYKLWQHAMGWLCKNKGLRVELLKALFYDLRNGHDVIIVPLDYKKHIDLMVKMVNQQAYLNNLKGEKWPKELAIKFYNGVDRNKVLDQVDRGGPTILFGMRSMIKQGIDFALPSKIHIFIPMSASVDRETGAPMLEQLGNRVCTPAKKPAPQIDIWFHQVKMFRSCNVGLFWNEVYPNRVTNSNQKGKYRVSEQTYEIMRNMNVNPTTAKDNFSWV